MKKLLVIGGNSDSGFRIVKRWSELGGSAAVTSRRPQLDDQAPDVECITLNPLEVDALREVLAPSEQIVVNVIGAWLRDAKRAIGDTTKSILAALPASTRYVHVSATSVYGHRPGQIINEDSPVSDTLEIGRIHAATDRAVLARPNSIVFRVPHLYGPDRERSLQRMFNGDFPVIGSGYNVMHHLHVEDFADAVVAAARGTYTGLLNVVDDGPEVYGDYCDFAAQLGGHPPLPRVDADAARLGALEPWLGPHFTQPELATEFVNFMISDTWFDNARAKAELDWTLTFPTFREGLTAIHKDQR